MNTPEIDKIAKVQPISQGIGEFLTWLQEQGIVLAAYHSVHDRLIPYHEGVEALLARYFEIDLDKIESEKQAILAEIRQANQAVAEVDRIADSTP